MVNIWEQIEPALAKLAPNVTWVGSVVAAAAGGTQQVAQKVSIRYVDPSIAEVGVYSGIAIGVCGLGIQGLVALSGWWFKNRHDARARELHALKLQAIREGRDPLLPDETLMETEK